MKEENQELEQNSRVSESLPSKSLNPDTIKMLQTVSVQAQGFLPQLIQLFFKTSKRDLDWLIQAVKDADLESSQRAAHRLRSSSGNVGALKLAAIFKEIEMLTTGQHLPTAVSLLEKAQLEYQRVCEELLELSKEEESRELLKVGGRI